MKYRISYMIIAVISIITLSSCIVGTRGYYTDDVESNDTSMIVKECDVQPFDKIKAERAVKVIYEQSDTFGLRIVCKQQEIDKVEYSVNKDGILKIYFNYKENKKKLFSHDDDWLKAYVSSPTLSLIDVSSASSFKSETIDAEFPSIVLKADEASSIKFDKLICDRVSMEIESAASLKINELETKKATADVNSASSLKISVCKSDTFKVDVKEASSSKIIDLQTTWADIAAKNASSMKIGFTNSKYAIAEAKNCSSVKLSGKLEKLSSKADNTSNISDKTE